MRKIELSLLLGLSLGATAAPYRGVDACFALDTTGSMSSMIDAAKEKIWFIANEIARAPSRPHVRLCLLAYRDRGDAYVTRHFDLTDDLDSIYQALMELEANGGGDGPEAVNQALLETVTKSSWSAGEDTLRVVFLVGDAPPHLDYDEPQYPEISALALTRGVVINPVLVGRDHSTRRIFSEIAAAAAGRELNLADPRAAERVRTPMDQDLAALNQRLGQLIVPYGSDAEQADIRAKQERSENLSEAAAADRLAFNLATGRIVQGRGDLLQDVDAGIADLADIDAGRLPPAMRSMDQDELLARLGEIRAEREELRRLIASLVAERRRVIAERQDREGFEAVVSQVIIEQMAVKLEPGSAGL